MTRRARLTERPRFLRGAVVALLVAAVAAAPACTGGSQQQGSDSEGAEREEAERPGAGAGSGAAGEPEEPAAEPDLSVRPDSGAPGSEVRLHAVGLPPSQRIRLGAGPVDSEYEIIAETRSDAEGRVDATVSVPSWAEAGDRFVFVAETPDHETKVLSEPFPVTAADRAPDPPGEGEVEVVEVTGRLTDEGVECQALRSDGGRLYTLLGDLQGFRTGDRVRVEGRRAEMSFCMQGTTLTVARIEEAGDARGTR